MNKVILKGNLVKDIELKYTVSEQPVISNVIAVKNDFKTGEEYLSEFINIKVWNHQAEYLNKYAKKGSSIYLEGRLTNRRWDKEDGSKGYITEVVVSKIELLKNPNQNESASESTNETINDFNQIEISDDELPF